jgi:hypothetical protein
METRRAEILLEKYFEGHSSLQEEQELRDFFRDNRDLPEALEMNRPFFEGLDEPVKEMEEQAFAERITGAIEKRERMIQRKRFTQRMSWVAGVAAALMVALFTLNIWSNHERQQDQLAMNEPQNPKQAYEMSMDALKFVSVNYNKGIQQLNKIPNVGKDTRPLYQALEVYGRGYAQMNVIVNLKIKQ